MASTNEAADFLDDPRLGLMNPETGERDITTSLIS
jgi:hypothetical protein